MSTSMFNNSCQEFMILAANCQKGSPCMECPAGACVEVSVMEVESLTTVPVDPNLAIWLQAR